eukprot:TRINITY_DN9660_c0_g1_i5.p1 TRINITY_DN9660_c0_g1~~TRINITY_DN9660_c0_g1_i5.p1  ORF type:complete len:334 (+),score=58.07 TRINITY_DN9660_c0_g1_i5:173-1174(+)
MAESSGLLKKVAIGFGAAAIAVCTAVVAVKLSYNKLYDELSKLRRKIKSGWQGNPALEPLKVRSEITLFLPKCHKIQFYVKIVTSKNFGNPQKVDSNEIEDRYGPFAKENCKPIFIANLSETHCLLYNKFHLVPYHVIIVTKEFVKKNTPLNADDFFASLKVMKALHGLVFFNSGPKSGGSQEHKNLQSIPYSCYLYHSIPIDILIDSQPIDESTPYFTLPQFNFKHIFYRFTPNVTKDLSYGNIKERAKLLEDAYKKCLKRLDNEDLSIAYNMVLAKNWMFIVLRKEGMAMNKIKINAVAFTGSFAVRSEEDYQFILTQDPFNILAQVAFPN